MYDATGSDRIDDIPGAIMCYDATGSALAKRLICLASTKKRKPAVRVLLIVRILCSRPPHSATEQALEANVTGWAIMALMGRQNPSGWAPVSA